MGSKAGLADIERYYDTVPRESARIEEIGPFTLFVSTGPFEYYARPHRDAAAITPAQVREVRKRQAELHLSHAFEWIDELHPELSSTVSAAGLAVFHAPLLVHADDVEGPTSSEIAVRMLSAQDPELPAVQAAIGVGFGHPGAQTGPAGDDARDEARHQADTDHPGVRARISAGSFLLAGAFAPTGAVGGGAHSPRDEITEITGVATLPAYRQRGIGSAVTTALVADAQARDVRTVFLSAGSDSAARIYLRAGFERVGTACIASTGVTDS